jgi:glutamate--cysteine ligase
MTATAPLPLAAAANSPVLQTLRELQTARGEEIEAWLSARMMESGAPFYASVDLRHSGFKLAPVDTNLFPAGFNQLSPAARARASARIAARLARYGGLARQQAPFQRILIIPENHTRNLGYLDNLVALRAILRDAGCHVEFGSLQAQGEALELASASGEMLQQKPLKRVGSLLKTTDDFCPQLILLNNDLTAGFPDLLRGVSQPMVPRPSQGWFRRRKSIYFGAYDKLARDFASSFNLDPWLITTEFHQCGRVNFGERQGLDCVAMGVEKVLHKIRGHYARYGITHTPYVFVKSDAGTYGMGIMTVHSGEELIAMNKKTRNKMHIIKEGVQSTEVIIQEGVPSSDAIAGAPAEPMLYLIDGQAVGGAYRVNDTRDAETNLNASGMRFVGMCDEAEDAAHQQPLLACQFGALGLIAELAALAAPREEYGENYAI